MAERAPKCTLEYFHLHIASVLNKKQPYQDKKLLLNFKI
jgi:hypothetical protein